MCVDLMSHASIVDYVFIGGSTLAVTGCVCAVVMTIRAAIIDVKNQKILDKMKESR